MRRSSSSGIPAAFRSDEARALGDEVLVGVHHHDLGDVLPQRAQGIGLGHDPSDRGTPAKFMALPLSLQNLVYVDKSPAERLSRLLR